jgi:hypothetical protein
MKVIYFATAAALLLVACGSDGSNGSGGGTNVQNAAELFENPTGTVTPENADEAVQQAIDATRAQATGDLGGGFVPFSEVPKQFDECISQSGTSVSVDYACVARDIGEDCVGQGNISTNVRDFNLDGSGVFVTQYNDAGLACGGGPLVLCSGPAETSVSSSFDTVVSCLDLTCTFEGESETTQGCFTTDISGNNLVLVTLDDGSVVCIALVASVDCSQACSEWEDAEGPSRIVCDVTETDGACSRDGSTIVSTENCVVDRTQTSCAGF